MVYVIPLGGFLELASIQVATRVVIEEKCEKIKGKKARVKWEKA